MLNLFVLIIEQIMYFLILWDRWQIKKKKVLPKLVLEVVTGTTHFFTAYKSNQTQSALIFYSM